jgi:hypothetical protein
MIQAINSERHLESWMTVLLREDDLLFFHHPQWHQFSCSPK